MARSFLSLGGKPLQHKGKAIMRIEETTKSARKLLDKIESHAACIVHGMMHDDLHVLVMVVMHVLNFAQRTHFHFVQTICYSSIYHSHEWC